MRWVRLHWGRIGKGAGGGTQARNNGIMKRKRLVRPCAEKNPKTLNTNHREKYGHSLSVFVNDKENNRKLNRLLRNDILKKLPRRKRRYNLTSRGKCQSRICGGGVTEKKCSKCCGPFYRLEESRLRKASE